MGKKKFKMGSKFFSWCPAVGNYGIPSLLPLPAMAPGLGVREACGCEDGEIRLRDLGERD